MELSAPVYCMFIQGETADKVLDRINQETQDWRRNMSGEGGGGSGFYWESLVASFLCLSSIFLI